jgi:hypothetical protein
MLFFGLKNKRNCCSEGQQNTKWVRVSADSSKILEDDVINKTRVFINSIIIITIFHGNKCGYIK